MKSEHLWKPAKNLSLHIDCACELVTLLMKRGIQMREFFKLDCLIGVFQHAITCFRIPVVTFSSQNPSFILVYSIIHFIGMLG
jgi:hypothetical protein